MLKDLKFYHCTHCHKVVEVVDDGKGTLVCCNEEMEHLVANTRDAASEKHVPVIQRKDGKIEVKVGSTAHPMTEEHLIEWVILVSEDAIQRVELKPNMEPKAIFADVNGPVAAYEYCNLHGLWKAEA